MLDKIISGGQTGADRAALDVAMRMGIDHGGWIARGRLAEDGPLPEKYRLSETGSADSRVRTEKNVISADGTLIVSHGHLTGGSADTEKMAAKHGRPMLHIDVNQITAFEAAGRINAWLAANRISVLNVAGPRASEDPEIYRAVSGILETAMHLHLMGGNRMALFENGMPDLEFPAMFDLPKSIYQAAKRLEGLLSFREKAELARKTESDGLAAYPDLISHIRNFFRLPIGNPDLLESCRRYSGKSNMPPEEAEKILVEFVLKKVRESHGLRRVK